MNRLGQFLVRYSKSALFGFIALVAISGIWGFQAFGLLKGGGYDDPGSDSAKVAQILTDSFDQATAEVVLIADFDSAANDLANIDTGKTLTKELEGIAGVDSVTSYFSMGLTPTLASDDGTAVYFFVDVSEDVTQSAVARNIANRFTGDYEGAQLYVAGFAAVTSSINHAIESDLKTAEMVAVPLVLLLLVFVFGSLVAAGLPMLIAGLSIVGTFFFIWLSAQFTDTSIFSVNLVSGLGLGLGIDYALLMVNRFREERAGGNSVAESSIRTLETAGRTVLFSGLTVAIVLGSLGFFPQYFLQSFALGGVVVVLIAVAGALIALPALLNLIGDKVNSVKIRKNLTPQDSKVWGSLARFVMKRPVSVLLVTLIGLGSLTSLAVGVEFGQVDDRVLKQDDRVVVASNFIRDNFTAREGSPVEILVRDADDQAIADYASSIAVLDNITRVQVIETKADGWTQIVAIHEIESRSPAGITLTDAIRTIKIDGGEVLVGGSAAIYTDSQQGIERQLPLAAGWIVIWTLILLFLFTGSILLPIKAVLLNVLSLGATFGFVTWVFAEGNLKWLIGDFFVTGTIDTSSSVMIVVVAFGLSMDYELFLLSRIKEQHDAGLGTNESVAVGLQRSGRIITAAALVLAFSFVAFVTSGVTIMKMLGLGIAFAILLDATVVRALLVPALMRLFGDANWWAPKWMKRIYKKVGLEH
jgi:RND superfamily putative drug exporter